jgi:hypothetical protein
MRFKYQDYKEDHVIPKARREDVIRIRKALWDGGMNTYLVDAYYMWDEYSYSLSAGWITPPETDEEIFNILVTEDEDE